MNKALTKKPLYDHWFIISTDGSKEVQFTFEFAEAEIITALAIAMKRNEFFGNIVSKAVKIYNSTKQ